MFSATPDPLADAVNGLNDWVNVLLAVGTVLTVIVLLIPALADIRDKAIENGFLGGPTGRLGSAYRRRRVTAMIPILESLGVDDAAKRAIRESTRPRKNKRGNGVHRPDIAFLDRIPRWIRVLDDSHTYHDTNYYLDLMGAIDGREQYEQSIDQIFESWISRLMNEGVIVRPDVMIAPKDGNVLLCRAVADRLGVPLVLCKGENDRARVVGPTREPHETDFEGLKAFCDREATLRPFAPTTRKYSALIIDDSCKNGTQLSDAARRFNSLSDSNQQGLAVQFERVESAVVLFRSLATKISNNKLQDAGLELHSLVAVGPAQLEALSKGTAKSTDIAEYKNDSSCGKSSELFGG